MVPWACVGKFCELTTTCAGDALTSTCVANEDTFDCSCESAKSNYSYELYGATALNACAYTIAACLQLPGFEADAFACMQTFEDHGLDARARRLGAARRGSVNECGGSIECKQNVSVNGITVKRHETVPMTCHLASDGRYACGCLWWAISRCQRRTATARARLVRPGALASRELSVGPDGCRGSGPRLLGPVPPAVSHARGRFSTLWVERRRAGWLSLRESA